MQVNLLKKAALSVVEKTNLFSHCCATPYEVRSEARVFRRDPGRQGYEGYVATRPIVLAVSKRLRDQRLYGPAMTARRVDPVGSFGAGVGPDHRETDVLAFHRRVYRGGPGVMSGTEIGPMLPPGSFAPSHGERRAA